MDKNSCAPRPPMGWNSYDYYDTNVNEQQVLENARYMARHLKPFGWEYVVVDIQWYAYGTGSMRDTFQYIPFSRLEMDGCGRLQPCPEKFPSSAGGRGFKPLADQIHGLGLKFGIHIMRGIPRSAAERHLPVLGCTVTADMAADPASICPWNPDMYGLRPGAAGQCYYDSLLQLYADWGVDFIKCDDICATGFGPVRQYGQRHEVEMLHRAIERCGRPMVLSLSPGPALVEESAHYKKYANMWRITDDFWDSWPTLLHMFERCEKWQDHVGPGSWPDCDMLPLGRVGYGFGQERQTLFTPQEQQTMLSLWCIFGSPLMLGAHLPSLDSRTLAMLQNKALLQLNQGAYIRRQVRRDENCCIWAAWEPITGRRYVALFNFTQEPLPLQAHCGACAAMLPGSDFAADAWQDLWTGQSYPTPGGTVPPHGVLLLSPTENGA